MHDTVGMSPFDAFIVSAIGAECLGVPHDGAILVLLADDAAAEAFGTLDMGELMSTTEFNTEPDGQNTRARNRRSSVPVTLMTIPVRFPVPFRAIPSRR